MNQKDFLSNEDGLDLVVGEYVWGTELHQQMAGGGGQGGGQGRGYAGRLSFPFPCVLLEGLPACRLFSKTASVT